MMQSGFSAFAAQMIVRLEVSFEDDLKPNMSLVDDLGFDSLQVYELISIIESMCGTPLPPGPPTVRTLGDAFAYFKELSGARAV